MKTHFQFFYVRLRYYVRLRCYVCIPMMDGLYKKKAVPGWLVGWLVGLLADSLAGWLARWPARWLVGCPAYKLTCQLIDYWWLAGWLAGWLGWLGWLVGW